MAQLDALERDVRAELGRQGFADKDNVKVERMLNMRFEGTDLGVLVLPGSEDDDELDAVADELLAKPLQSEFLLSRMELWLSMEEVGRE